MRCQRAISHHLYLIAVKLYYYYLCMLALINLLYSTIMCTTSCRNLCLICGLYGAKIACLSTPPSTVCLLERLTFRRITCCMQCQRRVFNWSRLLFVAWKNKISAIFLPFSRGRRGRWDWLLVGLPGGKEEENPSLVARRGGEGDFKTITTYIIISAMQFIIMRTFVGNIISR